MDAVSIWYGVPSEAYELPLGDVRALTRAAHATGLGPGRVTLLDDPRRLAAVVAETGVPTVQPHGYRTPARLAAIRARAAAGHLSSALIGGIRRAWDTARRHAPQEEQHALPG